MSFSRRAFSAPALGTAPFDSRLGSSLAKHALVAFLAAVPITVLLFLLTLPLLPLAILFEGMLRPGALFAITVAPVSEEAAKLLGVIGLGRWLRTRAEPEGWLAFGALVGMGFGLLENLVYTLTLGSQTIAVGAFIFLARLGTGMPLHALLTAVAAYGYGRFRLDGRWRLPLAALVAAILIHAGFNLLAFATGGAL